jgi:hypothetical protein
MRQKEIQSTTRREILMWECVANRSNEKREVRDGLYKRWDEGTNCLVWDKSVLILLFSFFFLAPSVHRSPYPSIWSPTGSLCSGAGWDALLSQPFMQDAFRHLTMCERASWSKVIVGCKEKRRDRIKIKVGEQRKRVWKEISAQPFTHLLSFLIELEE